MKARARVSLIPRCSMLTPQSSLSLPFQSSNLEGAKCVLVKVLRRAFVTAVLASEEQSNKALQSPLHCPCFIKTINLDVERKGDGQRMSSVIRIKEGLDRSPATVMLYTS